MKKNNILKFSFILFLVSIFLFKIPSFYLLPSVPTALFTTQALARFLVICVFISVVVLSLFDRNKLFNRSQNIIVLMFFIFFSLQSFSVLSANNIGSFLSSYKDVILGVMSFFVFYYFRGRHRIIILILLASALLNALFGFLLATKGFVFLNIIKPLVYEPYFNLLSADLYRGRIYIPTFDEITIPILLLSIYKSIGLKRLVYYTIFISITFLSFISNFRSNILMFLVALFGWILAFKRSAWVKIVLILSSVTMVAIIVNYASLSIFGYSFYDRLINQNGSNSIRPENHRFEQLRYASEMGMSSFFGVGLGNYYDNIIYDKVTPSLFDQSTIQAIEAQKYIHNIFGGIFAESGLISLVFFIGLLLLFVREDLIAIRKHQEDKIIFVIAFWVLFLYGLFNPTLSGTYQFLFWGLRGLIL